MQSLRRYSYTVTLSTAGAGTGYSTILSGHVGEIYIKVASPIGAGGSVTITSTHFATAKSILKVANPSTIGGFYYPRAIACGTTANSLGSTDVGAIVPIPLSHERLKWVVATSSDSSGDTVNVDVSLL